MPDNKPGLRDVIAGQTQICWLDEATQNFYYRGYSIQDLAEHCTFQEVAYLLLYGKLPTHYELDDNYHCESFLDNLFLETLSIRTKWSKSGYGRILPTNQDSLVKKNPMDVLGLMVRFAGIMNTSNNDNDSSFVRGLVANELLATVPVFCGMIAYPQIQDFSFVSGMGSRDFLYFLRGAEPDPLDIRALDLAAILYAEHEFNASTFAVRVAASAHTDLYSAVVAGISTLKGDRHGGANENAMKLMLEIGDPSKVSEYLEKFFAQPGARLPGFGHAVYTRSDPRVAILRPWVKKLSEVKGDLRWYEIALALEEAMARRAAEKGKGIPANADLWTAPLYYLLGIPIELYTPLFAAARVAGWCAHYLEVRYENKEPILRPRAEYVGPAPQPYVPIDKRE